MFFKTHNRINPATGKLSIYYRLAENNRDVSGSIKQQSIMGVGFMDDIDKEELDRIADCLNARVCGVQTLFKDENEKVRIYVDKLYNRLVDEKRIDRAREARKSLADCDLQRIDVNSGLF